MTEPPHDPPPSDPPPYDPPLSDLPPSEWPPAVERWFASRTWQEPPWTVEELVAAKAGRRVSVVLPALNEEATVGAIVTTIIPLTSGHAPLVDELVVIDSGSTDHTAEVAAAAGARVVHREDVLTTIPPAPGKGEVLWRALAATTGDILCYIDSDLIEFDSAFVPALLGPLLTTDDVHLVKGFYRRPLRTATTESGGTETSGTETSGTEIGGTDSDSGGGRVTELLVRPLLAALRPELVGVIQPLGGEYAGSREMLAGMPFAAGYGVEIGLLLDTHTTYGLNALAQVNLGVRKHRNRSLRQLGVMARQILAALLPRCDVNDSGDALTQFHQLGEHWKPSYHPVETTDRHPMNQTHHPNQR